MHDNQPPDHGGFAGFHDLPDDAEETPPPVPCRHRPVGQKTAMRMSRGSARGSQEVLSAALSAEPKPALTYLARIQQQQNMVEVIREWRMTDDPLHKEMLEGLIQSMRRDLGLPPFTGSAAGTSQGDDKE